MSIRITRRAVLATGSAFAAMAALGRAPALFAQDAFPSKGLQLVVGFPAGSGMDVIGRFVADRLTKVLGQTVLIENKPGALSHIASEYTARARPDGHTIYITGTGALAPVKHLFTNPTLDPIHDLQMITTINRQAFLIVVDAKSDIKTLADLEKKWRSKGKGQYGTTSAPGVVLGALYKAHLKMDDVLDVPFRTSEPALNALLAGDIDAIMADPQFGLAQVATGKLRPLGFAAPQRFGAASDIPTLNELGVPNIDLTTYLMIATAPKTPRPIVDKLHAAIKSVIMTDDGKKFLNQFGGDQHITTPEELVAILERDEKAWGNYVRIAKIPKVG